MSRNDLYFDRKNVDSCEIFIQVFFSRIFSPMCLSTVNIDKKFTKIHTMCGFTVFFTFFIALQYFSFNFNTEYLSKTESTRNTCILCNIHVIRKYTCRACKIVN